MPDPTRAAQLEALTRALGGTASDVAYVLYVDSLDRGERAGAARVRESADPDDRRMLDEVLDALIDGPAAPPLTERDPQPRSEAMANDPKASEAVRFQDAVRERLWGDAADMVRAHLGPQKETEFNDHDGRRGLHTDDLADWLAEGTWDGTETPESCAAEWDDAGGAAEDED